ncbi:MAG: hypothetical protein NVSMB55_01250 [Mycobacteriales bacterium]
MVIVEEHVAVRAAWLEHLVRAGYRDASVAALRGLFDRVECWLGREGLALTSLTPELAARLPAELAGQAVGLSVLLHFIRDRQLAPTAPALLASLSEHLHDRRGCRR